MTGLIQFYRKPGLCPSQIEFLKSKIETVVQQSSLESVVTELCFYIEAESKDLSEQEESVLKWVLSVPFEESCLTKDTGLNKDASSLLIEVGPRLNFSTALSTNSVAICQSFGFTDIKRIEYSIRYLLTFKAGCLPSAEEEEEVLNCLHDPMTQCRYTEPLQTFDLHTNPDPVFEVDVLGKGRKALEKANETLGLAFDPWDLDYYTQLFLEKVQRNPTSVECFDLAQSNSEHSRHWFFKGRLMVDGKEWPESLFSMIMNTQSSSNDNNIIKFNDNSSAIRGYEVKSLLPDSVVGPGKFSVSENETRHVIFTAETHNFPTGVAPFPGATTGTGGRIRDVQSTGRGAHVIAGTAGYSVGNLHIPGYPLEWEDKEEKYPPNFARPLDVLIEASNGASDYGNKFGEPVITGFARSCGLVTAGGERREYVKPIMFSGGIGMLDGGHVTKDVPEKSMEIVKIGGPVYRIGLGGGAASSVQVQGDNQAARDFSAVQRGDAEMEQKMNRVIRACAELGEKNPIRSIHDQGAGGNGNVLKEIVEPAGGVIHADRFQLGDPTISVMELWGAEYQESNAALVRHSDLPLVTAIGRRERCPVSHVGTVTGTGRIQLENFSRDVKGGDNGRKPVDLELEHVLGSMPRKVFEMKKVKQEFSPLVYPEKLSVRDALTKVLRLPSVASKRYLTNKVMGKH
ncbi:phosphoribosylformylglycinamidine synthase [Aplysia californica]|uniref:Phosphoribosylformylglycinamidine synthase n=1 Tax=Aplysia californica TaxID=6500 RepID=A0ABM1A218_APLCA|nr:phosphoribosylformylglycinamidine synthase [Aplysia californica]